MSGSISRRQSKSINGKKIAKCIGITFLVLVVILVLLFAAVCEVGKYKLKNQAVTASHEDLGSDNSWVEPMQTVEYEGKHYRYNEDLYVILCMGIDTENDMREEGSVTGQGGQSDANFLVVIDEKQKRISIIAIPRDTMTEIDIYDVVGGYVDSIEEHLALQYAYGNGGSESCEMMERAVSGLMYGMPVNGYVSFNLNAIELLNGMAGGVNVTLEDDFAGYQEGETIWLDNELAYQFIRERDCDEEYSADARLSRQKQYLISFVEKVLVSTKQDIRQPFRMYCAVSDYLITDLTMDEMIPLAVLGAKCEFSEACFYRVPGEKQPGEYYEEYQVDRQALYELIIQVFYLEES